MNSSTLMQRSPSVLQIIVDGQPILLHSVQWKYLHFTGTGAVIWELLEQPMSLDMLVSALRQRFAVDEETCRRESEGLLKTLLDDQFLIIN